MSTNDTDTNTEPEDEADEVIVCRDCGQEFTFSIGEQRFFAERQLLHRPVRCGECRRARKALLASRGLGE